MVQVPGQCRWKIIICTAILRNGLECHFQPSWILSMGTSFFLRSEWVTPARIDWLCFYVGQHPYLLCSVSVSGLPACPHFVMLRPLSHTPDLNPIDFSFNPEARKSITVNLRKSNISGGHGRRLWRHYGLSAIAVALSRGLFFFLKIHRGPRKHAMWWQIPPQVQPNTANVIIFIGGVKFFFYAWVTLVKTHATNIFVCKMALVKFNGSSLHANCWAWRLFYMQKSIIITCCWSLKYDTYTWWYILCIQICNYQPNTHHQD